MQRAKLIILLLLMLTGMSCAASVDFTYVIPVTVVLVAIFLASMKMLASAISSTAMEAWVKAELRELIAGVILVAIIYAFFITSRSATSAITGSGDYITTSVKIMNDLLTNSTTGYDRAMEDIIRAGTRIRAAASYAPYMSIPVYIGGITYSTSPLAGVGILFSSLSSATQGLANIIFLYEGIMLLLRFSYTAVPAVLLPVSLSLRLVPFTRKTGNTLIAACLGIMVLLPFSVIFVDQMNKLITYPQAYLSTRSLEFLDPEADAMTVLEPLCESMVIRTMLSLNDQLFSMIVCLPFGGIPIVGAAMYASCQSLVQYVVYPIIMIGTQVVYDATLLSWTIGGEGASYAGFAFSVLYRFLAEVNNLVLLGYIDSLAIAIITISGTRSISVALGGEWYLGGIQRLI